MISSTSGTGVGGSNPPAPRSVGGIYRKKHALRAVFRSASLLLVVGGYALYHGAGGRAAPAPHGGTSRRRLRSGGDGVARRPEDSLPAEGSRRDEVTVDSSRLLRKDDEASGVKVEGEIPGAEATVEAADVEAKEETLRAEAACPELEVASPTWLAIPYAIGTCYMFLALAIVCDEFFVPALEEISGEGHMNLSMDVAGATLMAAGGSAPELFTSLVGTFQQSDIGIGTIVGSAVFNVLFVIGMCSLLSREVLTLTWWPLFRDSAYYAVGLAVLSVVVGVVSEGQVYWWEALILLMMYAGYVALMYFNQKLYSKLTGNELGEKPREEEETTDVVMATVFGDDINPSTKGRTAGDGLAAQPRRTPSNPKIKPFGDDLNSSTKSRPGRAPSDLKVGPSTVSFGWTSTFRAGIIKLLLKPESWDDHGGIGIVTKIQGDVGDVFKKVDESGDGRIDREELGNLFVELGHEISEQELGEIFTSLDLDSNGTISEEEFTKWYVRSEKRILSKVKPVFDMLDSNKTGTLDREEVRELLNKLEVRVTEADVDDAIAAMYKNGSDEEIEITYTEFADWYVQSIIYTRIQTRIEEQIEEEEKGACNALTPRTGGGFFAWSKYLLVLPLLAALTLTIPDVRRPGYGRWCYFSFLASIAWIGVFSYLMVGWVEILGNTAGVPSVVMGYTVLAAGTSVPDLFSSVIVARMGEGDMAVSSSIGSNIFDILVGLPLPWLIYTLWPTTPNVVMIQATGIWQSIFILIGMLVAIIAIVHCQGWKMTKTLGGLMFVLYFAFLIQAIATEYVKNPCFG